MRQKLPFWDIPRIKVSVCLSVLLFFLCMYAVVEAKRGDKLFNRKKKNTQNGTKKKNILNINFIFIAFYLCSPFFPILSCCCFWCYCLFFSSRFAWTECTGREKKFMIIYDFWILGWLGRIFSEVLWVIEALL